MMLGAHNSMSYLKPKKWFLYPFKWIAQCQSKTLQQQYEDFNVRLFDFRIAYDKLGQPEFRHGTMAYKGDVKEALSYLNSLNNKKLYVRLVLEMNKATSDSERQCQLFTEDCDLFQEEYPNIKFICGTRKYDWQVLYQFKNKDIELDQQISSMQGNKLDDLWPWLYAKLHNKKSMAKGTTKKCLLLDFIEIQ